MRSEARSRARREVGLLGCVTSELDLPTRRVLVGDDVLGARVADVETTRFEVRGRASSGHSVYRVSWRRYPGSRVSVEEVEEPVSNEELRRSLVDLARGPLAPATGDVSEAFDVLGYDDAVLSLRALVAVEEVPRPSFGPAASALADLADGAPLEWVLRRLETPLDA